VHHARRGTSVEAAALLRGVLRRDERACTVMGTAADADRTLAGPVRALLDRHDRTRAACRAQYRTHLAARAAAEVVSAELPALRAEVALLEAVGGRSGGAGMYGTPLRCCPDWMSPAAPRWRRSPAISMPCRSCNCTPALTNPVCWPRSLRPPTSIRHGCPWSTTRRAPVSWHCGTPRHRKGC
jgi:hypothetical protein